MRLVRSPEEARRTLLRREAPEAIELPASVREEIRRVFGEELDVDSVVERILRDVRDQGDAAVWRYNREIDGVRVDESAPLRVSEQEIEAAFEQVDASLVAALRLAANRIREFHQRQFEHSEKAFAGQGVGQIVRPIERVGVYVPGTAAVYPSTVLMTAIPAKVAGVPEVIVATPAREDGSVSPVKLVAAGIGGVEGVFRAGGAQGIAALAFGTESIPRVDKVCGPGNVFVTVAKKRLYGTVSIDGLFGPSETLVIADEGADAALVAADLLAGAEHDELATVVLITTSQALADAVIREVGEQAAGLERRRVAEASLAARGGIVLVQSLAEALALANEFAPEHLCLHLRDAGAAAKEVRNAGCVFVGGLAAESLGDYAVGPSHVMPTGGSARYGSPLGVRDFLKATTVVELERGLVEEIGPAAAAIARGEGLTAHARAIERRLGRRD